MRSFYNGTYIDMDNRAEEKLKSEYLKNEAAERSRPLTAEEVSRMLIASQINSLAVDDSTALRMREFYPLWEAGQDYTAGFRLRYGGLLYKVLQAHTSRETWAPDAAPSLFAKVLIPDENVIPEWEQPDSTNGYAKGDKVTHKGKTWVSDVDNNLWEPGIYGWIEVV